MMTDFWRSLLILFFCRTLRIVGTYKHFKSEISGTLPSKTCAEEIISMCSFYLRAK